MRTGNQIGQQATYLAHTTVMAQTDTMQVAFIGLGAMGFGMASHLHKNPAYCVVAYDVNPSSIDKFQALGGRVAESARAAVSSSQVVLLMVTSASQIESVLFEGPDAAVKGTGHQD
jgi:3-hydroxyisobutyrate dehydrogenase-like beta-hydroxyacid dehydrogenase